MNAESDVLISLLLSRLRDKYAPEDKYVLSLSAVNELKTPLWEEYEIFKKNIIGELEGVKEVEEVKEVKEVDFFSKSSVYHRDFYLPEHHRLPRIQHTVSVPTRVTFQFQNECKEICRKYKIRKYMIVEELLINFLENPLETVRNIQNKSLHTAYHQTDAITPTSKPFGIYCTPGIVFQFQDVCKKIRIKYGIKQYFIFEEIVMNFLEDSLETVKMIQKKLCIP